MKIKRLAEGLNVAPLLWALRANPQLWNVHPYRTASQASPHHGVDDVWCRYADTPDTQGQHESIWYPAADLLPVREVAQALMTFTRGEPSAVS